MEHSTPEVQPEVPLRQCLPHDFAQRLRNGFGRGATAQRYQAGRPGHGSARRRTSFVPARTLRVWCCSSGIAAQLGNTTLGLFDGDSEC